MPLTGDAALGDGEETGGEKDWEKFWCCICAMVNEYQVNGIGRCVTIRSVS